MTIQLGRNPKSILLSALCLPPSAFRPLRHAFYFSKIRNPKSKILSAPCSALRVFLDHSPDFGPNFNGFN
ncbi:MAG: hypothetical protein ISS66_21375 [Desulfobacteraceae bacterium]|nr:hypothetical protein [Desulfobacteraceae bacterium]